MEKRGSWFRSMVLWLVDTWLEGITFLIWITLIYFSWQLLKLDEDYFKVLGVVIFFAGTAVLFLCAWLFFCIIEARDLLKQIEENTRGGITVNTVSTSENAPIQSTTPTPPTPVTPIRANDEKYCPYCHSVIKKSAKKCRFCGNWLEDNNDGGDE